jgi:prophage antirepressor-like protein
MKKNTNKTERQNYQILSFTFESHAVRTVVIDGSPWFVARDVCEVLYIKQDGRTFDDFSILEKGRYTIPTPGGNQEMLVINEPGLYRLIFQSRKPEAERFKTWVFTEVLPQIRRTGTFGPGGQGEVHRMAGFIYSRFTGCQDMTIQKINRLVYYLAVRPPLTQSDIAKLLGVSPTNVLEWKRRLPADIIEDAAAILDLTVSGNALALDRRAPSRAAVRKAAVSDGRTVSPLALPEKEAANEPNE